MSFPTLKKSIFALHLLGAAAFASFIGFSTPASTTLSQIERQFSSEREIAYRGTGRIDTGLPVAYRASGRFGSDSDGVLVYRGSERGIEVITGSDSDLVAYRASGRFGVETEENFAHHSSDFETIAYRASGRLENDLEDLFVYRGSERGLNDSLVG